MRTPYIKGSRVLTYFEMILKLSIVSDGETARSSSLLFDSSTQRKTTAVHSSNRCQGAPFNLTKINKTL